MFAYHWFHGWICDPHYYFKSRCLQLKDTDKEFMFITLCNMDLNQQCSS
jgi:hypothetical protein